MSSFDIFLKIDGIEGESQDPQHKGELEITSFSKTVHNKPKGTGPEVVTWGDADFLMFIDKGFTKIFTACTTGAHIKKAVVTFRKAGGGQKEFLVITFSDVLISSCRLQTFSRNKHDDGSREIPIVEFTFNFAQIKEEYKVQKADGTLGGTLGYSYSLQDRQTKSQ